MDSVYRMRVPQMVAPASERLALGPAGHREAVVVDHIAHRRESDISLKRGWRCHARRLAVAVVARAPTDTAGMVIAFLSGAVIGTIISRWLLF